MSHPLFWPGQYYFYPIGNTPAVCLTRDLAPEEPTNILILGCGDPRNILYTIFSEPQIADRTLDFTCCDMDPAVLARNVLLFSMVADKLPHTTVVWDIFFHMYLDKDSYLVLVEQCRKLIGLSDSLQHWTASSYGSFLKMCTEHTLVELRRHWSLYVDMQDLPRKRAEAIRHSFAAKQFPPSDEIKMVFSSVRFAGPVLTKAIGVACQQFQSYWETGVTFSDPKQIAAATLLNPTFVYSLGGELCSVHYGVDPLNPFHLAALFGNAKEPVSVADAVKAAKTEFSSWCSAFQTSISSTTSSVPIIRFFLGEATAVCRALQAFAVSGVLDTEVPAAPWKAQSIQFSRDEFISGGAPVTFNVIDTSNLNDHIGLLNVLIATIPLLSTSSGSSALYTESLLFRPGQNATKEFSEGLFADITTVGLLLGLCPVDYLSGFTTRSNTHELLLYDTFKKVQKQFHQVTVWKVPTAGDAVVARGECQTPVFDPHQLGTLLYDIYNQLFEQEDPMTFWKLNEGNLMDAISTSNLIHYTRESFVLLLKLVKDRLGMSEKGWLEVMNRFFNVLEAHRSLLMNTVKYQDLCANLHRHGVYTIPVSQAKLPNIARFSNWDSVPPLVRIILMVPRKNLASLMSSGEQASTPLLQCEVRGRSLEHIFRTVHVAWARVVPIAMKTHPQVIYAEDPEGWSGSSPLAVSFTIPTGLLTNFEPVENLRVCFSVWSTPATVIRLKELGIQSTLFSAKLTDESCVHILPEQALPTRNPQMSPPTSASVTLGWAQIGESSAASVELDEECEFVASLTSRVSVIDVEAKRLFGSGATPKTTQVSPCVMKITIESRTQRVVYPFPVIGSQYKLRLARKSLYIDVVVPVSGQFKPKLNLFPVIGTRRVFSPWNIHRVNLSRLPVLDVNATKVDIWLNAHAGSMLSSRERSLKKKRLNDCVMFVKDTLHTILVRSSGIQAGAPRRVFSLIDTASKNCDTIFFISDIRFDLSSHAMICDGYVLPLTDELMPKIRGFFPKLLQEGNVVNVSAFEGEMRAWKQLLPALVERCRSSWKHKDSCEYESQGEVPLSEAPDEDPLCSCGRGKDVEGMSKVGLWSQFAPYVTRIALSPLFGVSYLETMARCRKCSVCKGKGKLMTCAGCKMVRYCSKDCQKKDWKAHKIWCKS